MKLKNKRPKSPLMFATFALLAGCFSSSSQGASIGPVIRHLDARGMDPKRLWPEEHFSKSIPPQSFLSSPQCARFLDHATRRKPLIEGNDASVELTDQLMVLKGGRVVYEWSDAPHYNLDTRHYLWSASKSVTATVMAAAIQRGIRTPRGAALSLESPLNDFYSFAEHSSDGPNPRKGESAKSNEQELYSKIKLKHLLMMGSGMKWDESYEGDPMESSFIPMLYLNGRADMANFAIRAPMLTEPGTVFNYSGGNSLIMMGMLKKMFPQDPAGFPSRLLFDELGMRSALYERDASGTFVGSSYAHMNPEDMLRLGYLYLNGGIWKGKRILPVDWTDMAQTASDTLTAPGSKPSYDGMKAEGVFSNASFWLNKQITGDWIDKDGAHQSAWGPEMPHSPGDLFFMAGHYGQVLMVVPSEDLVIARTGHDSSYWDNEVTPVINKIDPTVSGAIECFKNWEAK